MRDEDCALGLGLFRAHVCSSTEVISHCTSRCPSRHSATAPDGATLAAAGVKAPPGDSRSLLASLAAHSRGYRRGFAAGAGGSGTLSPGISASLAPLLWPRHFSSFQCLELLIPIPTGSQAAQRGNVSDCRSAAGAQRRGKPRGKGKLEQKH